MAAATTFTQPTSTSKPIRMTVAWIKAGDRVMAGYKQCMDENVFLGFTDNDEACSETPKFSSLSDLYEAKGVNCIKDLEDIEEATGASIDHRFYAMFRSVDGDTWASYLYCARFAVGSSGYALKLAAA
jgi:hypothetical protein